MISEYAEKLKKEFDYINSKYEKLIAFLEYHKDTTALSPTLIGQLNLMVVQKAIMNAYLNILVVRMTTIDETINTNTNTNPDEDDHK